jgi:mRNA-degrading endonuclease RelE of RelBE toxin-antitoxin system
MTYVVEVTRKAQKEIQALEKAARERVVQSLLSLEENQGPMAASQWLGATGSVFGLVHIARFTK